MSDRLDATVVICTRNRSWLLNETCSSLLTVEDEGLSWEVLIVDNASTDDTLEIAEEVRRRSPERVRLIGETEIGLSAARNAGVRSARGRIIAFLDDDAYPEPGWLRALLGAFDRDRVYAAGGPVEPRFESPLPAWFSARFLPYLTVWDRGPVEIELSYNEYPRGANMAFRREAFERFGLFSTSLGRKAGSLLSCEELELCLRIERGGGLVLYVPGARVEHLVRGSRVTAEWLESRFRSQGRSEAILEWQHAGLPGLARGVWRSLRHAAGALTRSSGDDERLLRRCELEACRGYLAGALSAPLRVPLYRPLPEAGPPLKWRPPR